MSFDSFSTTPFSTPEFSLAEPGEDQRWSTWTAITPSQRGPRPWPDWVVTSAGAFDTELGRLKSGKEADVFLIERGVPDDTDHPDASVVLAAKRYRSAETSDFHRSAQYQEGRRMRNTRDARAVARGSTYGRSVAAGRWAFAEFEALCVAHERGIQVPYPVQVNDTEILMEFIGDFTADGAVAAPRLAQTRPTSADLVDYFEQVVAIMHGFALAGVAHGDLSPYNLLVHGGRVVVIDLPQIVEVVSNPNGMELLHRDCVNVCDWFTRRGLDCDAEAVFGELVGDLF